jgi:hypothetical protein
LCSASFAILLQKPSFKATISLRTSYYGFFGTLGVVVSGEILYDKNLSEERCPIEFRVAKYCPTDEPCAASKTVPTFRMLVNVARNLRKLLGGRYDSQQTLMSQPRVRRKLCHSPFQYPKGSHNSIKIQTQRTAQEIMRWLLDRPVSREPFGSGLTFNISLEQQDPKSKRRSSSSRFAWQNSGTTEYTLRRSRKCCVQQTGMHGMVVEALLIAIYSTWVTS